jgi:ferredoxin
MSERIPLTLGRFRFAVQLAMLVLTVWGAAFVGSYVADRLSTALPALSCAYDNSTGAHCVLVPLQHQMHHRVGEVLAKTGQLTLTMFLPVAMTVLSFFAFFFVLNKAFCGWICPLGTVQEIINRVGRRFNLPLHTLSARGTGRVRPVKWLAVLLLILGLPVLAGLGVLSHGWGNPFCDICPSRLATTLLSGSTEQLGLREDGLAFTLGAFGNALFGFVIVGALAVRQPFCRICPMLGWNALFQRLSPLRLVKRQHDKCEQCGICTRACPMDIPEIAREHGRRAFAEDCTLCGRCVEYCPDDGVIQLKWGPLRLFASSREYYKRRVKGESPDGVVKPLRFVRKPAAPARSPGDAG